MKVSFAPLVALLAVGNASPSFAGWEVDGNRLCPLEGQKTRSAVLADGAGGMFVTWEEIRQPSTNKVYCSRLTGLGTLYPGWPQTGVQLGVNQASQGAPSIIADGLDGAVVTWVEFSGTGFDIRVQRIDSEGRIVGGWPGSAVVACSSSCGFPVIVSDDRSGALVVWSDARKSEENRDIYAQHVTDAAAIDVGWAASGLPISVAPHTEIGPAAAADGEGGAFVAWTSFVSSDVFIQRVTSSGSTASGWPADPMLVCGAPGDQRDVVMVPDGSGGVLLAWYDARTDDGDIYAQRITSTGAVAPGWTVGGVPVCTASRDQVYPRLVAMPSGDVVIAWRDFRNGLGYQVFAQRLTAAGTLSPGWPADGSPVTDVPSNGWLCAIVPDQSDGVILTWEDRRNDEGDIYAQRLTANGIRAQGWPSEGVAVCTAAGRQYEPSIGSDGANGALVSWTDGRRAPFGDIYVARITAQGLTGPAIIAEPPRLQLLGVRPNPMRAQTAIRFRLPSPAVVSARVFDPSGRMVAVLAQEQAIEAGEQALSWNGRDHSGRAVRPGLYLMQISSLINSVTGKVIVLAR